MMLNFRAALDGAEPIRKTLFKGADEALELKDPSREKLSGFLRKRPDNDFFFSLWKVEYDS